MMDLADEVHDMLDTMKLLVKEHQGSGGSIAKGSPLQYRNCDTSDLIDIDSISFSDDETWLYKSRVTNNKMQDLHSWLYQDNVVELDFTKPFPLLQNFPQLESKKSIDSRTFTRPKKRLNRPSIEHYNEGYFKMDRNKFEKNADIIESSTNSSATSITENGEVAEDNHTPLNFDFTQPTTSNIFDRITTNGSDVDSFQNMSPPSLVNSMCSSTFNNLMENSYIKNDPLLREIRDADLTDDMLEDCELPVFKSFTDSCSSLCSDEQVLKQLEDKENVTVTNSKESSLNDTYSAKNTTVILNCTYQKDSGSDIDNTFICDNIENEKDEKSTEDYLEENSPPLIVNGTFRKSSNSKLNSTFCKSFKNDELLNDDLNQTVTLDCTTTNCLNNIKRRSYLMERQKCNANVKRNSGGYSASSTDSLDYMSSVSSSSKGSNKMLNMAEVDAIVLQQEQSLQQVMSTPKPLNRGTKLWESTCISPIAPLNLGKGDHLSDSDSNDDYRTIGSDSSNLQTPYGSEMQMNSTRVQENYSSKSSTESARAVQSPKKTQRDFKQSYSNLKSFDNNLKSSYGNLRHTSSQIKGSYSNIATSNLKGSYSNLKLISSDLRSSYTQLKPVLRNLPQTQGFKRPTVPKQKDVNDDLKIAEVAPTLRDLAPKNQVKPLPAVSSTARPVKSSLPRPVSCIPRPTQSRIPAPPATRPSSYSRLTRPLSKHFNGDF